MSYKVIRMTFEMRAELRETFESDDPSASGRAVRKLAQYLDTCTGVVPESVRFVVEDGK
jgi:hypothetical protein